MSAGRADVRGFYAALGIELPDWAQSNATVRCFADPGAHAHGDEHPSCSVSLEHGAWRCWACGAHGGAYDAALARGHTPSSAMGLKVRHGLAEPSFDEGRPAAQQDIPPRPTPRHVNRRRLAVSDAEVTEWHQRLFSDAGRRRLQLLSRQRLWAPWVVRELGLGFDGQRVTIPIRNASGQLRGVLRYLPGATTHKMLAISGTRLGLIPHPANEPSHRILLVEGPPDMIAARSRGWPAVTVPGANAWKPQWAELLQGREVIVVMDSDQAGRDAAARVTSGLDPVAASVRAVDLAPHRADGFDLTDWLRQQPQRTRGVRCTRSLSPTPTITR